MREGLVERFVNGSWAPVAEVTSYYMACTIVSALQATGGNGWEYRARCIRTGERTKP